MIHILAVLNYIETYNLVWYIECVPCMNTSHIIESTLLSLGRLATRGVPNFKPPVSLGAVRKAIGGKVLEAKDQVTSGQFCCSSETIFILLCIYHLSHTPSVKSS